MLFRSAPPTTNHLPAPSPTWQRRPPGAAPLLGCNSSPPLPSTIFPRHHGAAMVPSRQLPSSGRVASKKRVATGQPQGTADPLLRRSPLLPSWPHPLHLPLFSPTSATSSKTGAAARVRAAAARFEMGRSLATPPPAPRTTIFSSPPSPATLGHRHFWISAAGVVYRSYGLVVEER